jgi:uncharacterized protein
MRPHEPQSPFAVHLREITGPGIQRAYDLTGEFATETLDGTEARATRLGADVSLQKTERDVFVRGKIAGDLVVACSRCAAEAKLALDAKFDATYMPVDEVEEPGVDLSPEDADVRTYVDDEIDLKEMLREELLLALPIAPLCREDCKGLCPRCGKDWNEGPCDCPPEPKDDRFAALRNVKL